MPVFIVKEIFVSGAKAVLCRVKASRSMMHKPPHIRIQGRFSTDSSYCSLLRAGHMSHDPSNSIIYLKCCCSVHSVYAMQLFFLPEGSSTHSDASLSNVRGRCKPVRSKRYKHPFDRVCCVRCLVVTYCHLQHTWLTVSSVRIPDQVFARSAFMLNDSRR